MTPVQKKVDVLVIGGGIFGSVISATLLRSNFSVAVVDDARPNAGSRPAACLIKPSWLSTMKRPEIDSALFLLDALYGTQEIRFNVLGKLGADLFWVDPKRIMAPAPHRIEGSVARLHPHYALLHNTGAPPIELNFAHLVVAAGVWTNSALGMLSLPPVPGLKAVGGWAFTWRAESPIEPAIKIWAPYKQLVRFNRAPGEAWIGDGSALKPESMTGDRCITSLDRCKGFLPEGVAPVNPTAISGFRPYADSGGLPAYVQQWKFPGGSVIAATGGAKNGTMGAAWAAQQIEERLR